MISLRMLQIQERSEGTQTERAMERKTVLWVHSVSPRMAAGTKAGSFCGTALVNTTSDVSTTRLEETMLLVVERVGSTVIVAVEVEVLVFLDLVLDDVRVGRTVREVLVEVVSQEVDDDVRVGRTLDEVVSQEVELEVVDEVAQEVELEVVEEVVSQSEVELELLEG